ncbi:MAG: cytochrome-c peroxidase, partial [Actinomycetota bacterium]
MTAARSGLRTMVGLAAAGSLVLAACGDDSGAGGDAAGEAPATTAAVPPSSDGALAPAVIPSTLTV